MGKLINVLFTCAAAAMLAACGGGGGGSGPSNVATQDTEVVKVDPCADGSTLTSNDPLIAFAWHLRNAGQYFASFFPAKGSGVDLCMGKLWAEGVVGTGVRVNVVDTGLEIAHEDLAANVMADVSYNHLSDSADPTETATSGDHGTSVAGLIAAVKDNGKGSAGVAPGAKLMGYNYLASNQTLLDGRKAFGADLAHLNRSGSADIFNYSAGSDSESLGAINVGEDAVFVGLLQHRSGKGAVLVKSAGNGFDGFTNESGAALTCKGQTTGVTCQNVNQDTANTHYLALVVAAVTANGKKSSYSSTGSAVWASGFGGEYGHDASVSDGYIQELKRATASSGPGAPTSVEDIFTKLQKPAMLTTDQSGCDKGYTRAGQNANALDRGDGTGKYNPNCNYTATFNGTSSAAPTVSGVVALMLQTNPALTWRDVRHILARTARRTDTGFSPITNTSYFGQTFTLEQGWVTNAAGYHFHNWYGFGLVNAAAAVAMAKTYTAGSLGEFKAETATASIGTTTVSKSIQGVRKDFVVTATRPNPATVEQAELMFYVGADFVPSCAQLELTSPAGTQSILLNADSAHSTAAVDGVRFLSNAFYGEAAGGKWTLRIINVCSAALHLSALEGQQLTIRGR